MNERIKLLAIEAEKLSLQYANKNNVNFVNAFNTVFAELIVKECANRLAEDFIPEDEIIEGYNDTWDSALRFGAQAIKEHFGVEE